MLLKPLCRLILGLLFFSLSPGFLFAQEDQRELEVRSVRFQFLRPAGGIGNWLEIEVQLNVRGSADPENPNPRYVDNVRVVLSMSSEVKGAAGETLLRFYRSEAEIPTLVRGTHAVRFYLPPEIVGRDRLSRRPHAYLVDLFADGRQQELTSAGSDPLLGSDSVRRSFRSRIASDASGNDGILLPSYLTPFEQRYPRDTPSFIRRSPGR